MPTARLEGVDLFYEVTGDGPTIVFAHGAGGNHLVWYQQVAFFAQRYRCVTFDHRMFGRSEDRSGEGRAAFARDLEGLLDHLAVDAAYLVGQSMGGGSVFPFAATNPRRVRKLVMADTVGGMNTPVLNELREKLRQPAVPGDDRGRGGFSPSFRQRNPAAFLLYQQIFATNPPQPEAGMAAPTRPFTVDDIAGVATPTLFIVGEEDPLAPPPLIQAASQLLPDARVQLVRGAGHSVYFEKPDIFNHIVDSFFDEGSD